MSHGAVIQQVADALNCYILFRECGPLNVKLIEEHYAMKSSRLHAKSCDWGPMAGFVCMDPRLNKKADEKTLALNRAENAAALAGTAEYVDPLSQAHAAGAEGPPEVHVDAAWVRKWTGGRDWKGGYGPLLISEERKKELNLKLIPAPAASIATDPVTRKPLQTLLGSAMKGRVSVLYRLVQYPLQTLVQLKLALGGSVVYPDHWYWAIQVMDTLGFKQLQGNGTIVGQPAREEFAVPGSRGWTWLLGMTNPTPSYGAYGFKACVTGDYDLFSVWPRQAGNEAAQTASRQRDRYEGHTAGGLTRSKDGRWHWGGVQRWGQDARLVGKGFREPIIVGNMTGRLANVKDRVNQALRRVYFGGDCIYHSDEVGNPGGLAKPLSECFPMVGFAPRGAAFGPLSLKFRGRSVLNGARAFGLYTADETLLAKICVEAIEMGYRPDLKEPWRARLKSLLGNDNVWESGLL